MSLKTHNEHNDSTDNIDNIDNTDKKYYDLVGHYVQIVGSDDLVHYGTLNRLFGNRALVLVDGETTFDKFTPFYISNADFYIVSII